MGSLLRVKIIVILFSIVVLGVNMFFGKAIEPTPHLKRWREIAWTDFEGAPDLASKYSAGIASDIYLEFDSMQNRYMAYAGQNCAASWTKDSADYLLKHEQYHFNITEVHARLMNKFISENPGRKEKSYINHFKKIRRQLHRMQKYYDDQTDHSLVFDKQMYWEYKIDSLLASHSGWTTDEFTGATAFFPDTPELSRFSDAANNYTRQYILEKYQTSFYLRSYQNKNFAANPLQQMAGAESHNSLKVLYSKMDTLGDEQRWSTVFKTPSGFTTHCLWIYDGKNLYNIAATPPKRLTDSLGFNKMIYSFLNSFKLRTVDPHWTKKKINEPDVFRNLSNVNGTVMMNSRDCILLTRPFKYGIYSGPFFRDDGSMLIAYDVTADADSLRSKSVLMIDDDLYTYKTDSATQVYLVPAQYLPQRPFIVTFGYTLKADSLKKCDRFFCEEILVR